MKAIRFSFPLCGLALLLIAAMLFPCGCVSKSRAATQARAAFLAGQQRAMQQMQTQGPTVTFVGEVKQTLVPWTAGLTLAQGLLAANYFGATDPRLIVIHRGPENIEVEPSRLLSGEDIPLEPRDVIEINR
jgi:hypothetical protein